MVNIGKTIGPICSRFSVSRYKKHEIGAMKAHFFYDTVSIDAYYHGIQRQMHDFLGKEYWPINGKMPNDFWDQIRATKARFIPDGNE